MHNYKFNVPWWNNVCNNFLDGPGFMKHFVDKPTKALQIGCFEGMGTVWILDKILTHKDSTLIDVDTFEAEGDLTGANFETVKKLYYHNLKECPNVHKHKIIVGKSEDVLKTLKKDSFDLIYVDGSHFAKDVAIDAELSHKLIKVGGTIFFDDYDWNTVPDFDPAYRPKEAIDEFLKKYKDNYRIIDIHYQAVVQRIK